MRNRESGSIQGLAAFFIIVVVASVLWIALSPIVDTFVYSPNTLTLIPLSFERSDAINTAKTVWWVWPMVCLGLGGIYYWKEAIRKRSGEV